MATMLNDAELTKLIGTVIKNGDKSCIRPNSYILRLGKKGEFLNNKRKFEIDGKIKRGIKVQPGHSVNLSAYEDIDFRREEIHKIFPGCDLHAFVSPTTDLSREGLMATTTQVDAGYHGTLNWTLTNTSNEEQSFIFGEGLFRLTFFKLLEQEEIPIELYGGHYQGKYGHVSSERNGPPRGMSSSQWINSKAKGGPEEKLEEIINAGWPFNTLGKRLKAIEGEFKEIRDEYDAINTSIKELKDEIINEIKTFIPDIIKNGFNEHATMLQYKWLIGAAGLIGATLGILLTFITNDKASLFLKEYNIYISPMLIMLGIGAIIFVVCKGNMKNANND
jgi:deoxycytidine triphosphate deaminase